MELEQLSNTKQFITQYSTPLNVINPEIEKGLFISAASDSSSSSSIPSTSSTKSRDIRLSEIAGSDTQLELSTQERTPLMDGQQSCYTLPLPKVSSKVMPSPQKPTIAEMIEGFEMLDYCIILLIVFMVLIGSSIVIFLIYF